MRWSDNEWNVLVHVLTEQQHTSHRDTWWASQWGNDDRIGIVHETLLGSLIVVQMQINIEHRSLGALAYWLCPLCLWNEQKNRWLVWIKSWLKLVCSASCLVQIGLIRWPGANSWLMQQLTGGREVPLYERGLRHPPPPDSSFCKAWDEGGAGCLLLYLSSGICLSLSISLGSCVGGHLLTTA